MGHHGTVPEGDTVWRVAARLRPILVDEVLVACDLRVPALATTDLGGRVVVAVEPRGKHLLTRVSGRAGDAVPGGLTLHTHLRMDGSWRTFPHGARWTGGPDHQVRAVLSTSAHDVVGYRLGLVELVATAQEDLAVGHLGPDVLADGFDADEAAARLRRAPDRPVGEALVDQRNVAGLGTIYRAETLFLTGVSPWTPVRDVPDLAAVVRMARRIMRANLVRDRQVTTGDLRPGRGLWVYDRARRPCRRCATAVRGADQGEAPRARPVWWCPACQPQR
jgi:endonuclease-8